MRWRFALRIGGAGALVVAVTLLVLQVRVGGAGPTGRSCGSALDVIADRTDWDTWFAQDRLDVPAPPAAPLLRTLGCPDAVNTRTALSAALAAVGFVAVTAAIAPRRPSPTSAAPTRGLPARVRRLGFLVTGIGTALVLGGLIALGVLLADRQATMFVFVPRPYVALIGLVVLTPVLALIAGGRALVLLADGLEEREVRDATP